MVADGFPGQPGGFAAGSLVAGYRLEEHIGTGGMAMVFRAHDAQLNRPVALKILLPELAADPVARQRFIAEGQAAAKVNHPHIVSVFDAGEDEAGTPYIAMQYVPGGDLGNLLRRESIMAPRRAMEFISSLEAEVSSREAACSEEPWARPWLDAEICEAALVT